jgi:hypothetical protein
VNGCELKKCDLYNGNRCTYKLEICKFREAEINTVFEESGDNDYSERLLMNRGITLQEINYIREK